MKLDTTAELKIKFKGEKQRYTVRAAGKRYLVCTKPFNARKTVLYTIIDLKKEIRGRDNHHGFGYETQEDCEKALAYFESGGAEVSRRHNIPLEIEEVYARYR